MRYANDGRGALASVREDTMTLSWTVGDVTIRRVVELETPVPYSERYPFIKDAHPDALAELSWLQPHFATPEGHLLSSVHALLVEAPGLRLVVDTCLGNDKPRRMTGKRPLQTDFLERFAAQGCDPARVDAVLCTHLHVDHVGWNTRLKDGQWVPTFPNARYLVSQTEHAYWLTSDEDEQRAIMQDSIQPIVSAGLLDLIAPDARLSPEISLLPTPGHTPGHVSVHIESRGSRALITGDVLHHPCQMARPSWATPWDEDRGQAERTRASLLAQLADAEVLVIGTHFAAPTAGHVKRDGDTYRFQT